MKKMLKRYGLFLAAAFVNVMIIVFFPEAGLKSINITWDNTLEMLAIVPPIFVLLGLLDVWVPRETMIKLLGEKSGMIGIVIAFLMGSAAAGPLYAAFPVAGILMKKGSRFSNVLIFIGAWSTTKIPLLLFEATSMGWKFMLTRFLINLPVIAIIAYMTERLLGKAEKTSIYKNAEALE